MKGITDPIHSGVPSDVTVEAIDAAANRVTTYSGTIRFTSTDVLAQLPADYTFTAADVGIHTFSAGVTFASRGTQSVTAQDLASPALLGSQQVTVSQGLGASCSLSSECESGFCADGVCCDTACEGVCTACNLSGSSGRCTVEADGAACSDALYCNGAEVCAAGTCQAGSPVVCDDAQQALVCSEPAHSCVPASGGPPTIVRNASSRAGVSIPYLYNALGAVHAVGDLPLTFTTCGAPVGFAVDGQSGSVSWTPVAEGRVGVCVQVTNALGTDRYTFTVDVGVPMGNSPVAAFSASPASGTAPLATVFDATASTADPSTTLVTWGWDYGDGAAPGSGSVTSHLYAVPGGYQVRLRVGDGFRRTADASRAVSVLTASGQRPPSARILSAQTHGSDSLTVQLACDCQQGDAPIRNYTWDLGGISSHDVSSPIPSRPAGTTCD